MLIPSDSKRSNVEFHVGEEVLLRMSPTKGVITFNIKGERSPWYIGPFIIVAQVGKLAYRLELPKSMKGVHNVLHVFTLRKHFHDLERQITMEPIMIEHDLTY
jgi:hypothetical protein